MGGLGPQAWYNNGQTAAAGWVWGGEAQACRPGTRMGRLQA